MLELTWIWWTQRIGRDAAGGVGGRAAAGHDDAHLRRRHRGARDGRERADRRPSDAGGGPGPAGRLRHEGHRLFGPRRPRLGRPAALRRPRLSGGRGADGPVPVRRPADAGHGPVPGAQVSLHGLRLLPVQRPALPAERRLPPRGPFAAPLDQLADRQCH